MRELDDNFFARARPGRPTLPETVRKKRVNIMLDPEVLERLKAEGGNISARINRALRNEMGL